MNLLPKKIFELGIKIQFLKNAAISRYNVVYENRKLIKDGYPSVLGLLFSLKNDLEKHGICETEIGWFTNLIEN